MKERIAFFLPTRKGSERVKNKNTKPFAGIEGGLMENKIKQLVELSCWMRLSSPPTMKLAWLLLRNMLRKTAE